MSESIRGLVDMLQSSRWLSRQERVDCAVYAAASAVNDLIELARDDAAFDLLRCDDIPDLEIIRNRLALLLAELRAERSQ